MITLLTNDLDRTAIEIAALYKSRWQIELLFRWIKQHLDIRKFLGTNDNAIRLQVLAAMIAYLLLRIAARAELPHHASAQASPNSCVSSFSHGDPSPPSPNRRPLTPANRQQKASPNQLEFCYA